jgi:hypothetical protein
MDDAKLHNDIPNELIQDLPTVVSGNMRSPFDLANLTAGVQGTDTDVRIGGGQQAGWGATLGGGSVAGNRLGSAVWSGVNWPPPRLLRHRPIRCPLRSWSIWLPRFICLRISRASWSVMPSVPRPPLRCFSAAGCGADMAGSRPGMSFLGRICFVTTGRSR